MDELVDLTRLLEPQMAGREPVTREQVEKWRELYPYFSLPLLLYLQQNRDSDAGLCARATVMMGDLECLASLIGKMGDFTSIYPPERQARAETTDDAIELFLQTYGKNEDKDDNALLIEADAEPQPQEAVVGRDDRENVVPPSVSQEGADASFVTIPAYDYTGMLEAMPDAADASPMQGDDLLSRFIEADESGERMFLKSATDKQPPTALPEIDKEPDSEPLFTESLAKIYIRQRKYAKALEIIRKLSLNNPEKNIYFADQIRFLEKLIINIKN